MQKTSASCYLSSIKDSICFVHTNYGLSIIRTIITHYCNDVADRLQCHNDKSAHFNFMKTSGFFISLSIDTPKSLKILKKNYECNYQSFFNTFLRYYKEET